MSDNLNQNNVESMVVDMDGFQLSREQLSRMPDPAFAFKRRGAPFTFVAEGFVAFVQALKESCKFSTRTSIKGPSFDHKRKDPEPNGIYVGIGVKVVIIEGLYTLLDIPLE